MSKYLAVGSVSLLIIIIDLLSAQHYTPPHQCPFAQQWQQQYEELSPHDTAIAEASAPIPVSILPPSGYSSASAAASWLQRYFLTNNANANGVYDAQQTGLYPPTATTTNGNHLATNNVQNLQCASPPFYCPNETRIFRSFDGSCNNLLFPGFGMAKSRHARLLPPNYGDSVHAPTESVTGTPLPNPRSLSLALFGEETLPDGYLTLITMQWGQVVAHDISELARNKQAPDDCCENTQDRHCYAIPLHSSDPIALGSNKKCLHFTRSLADLDMNCRTSINHYAEKISVQTAYLDLSSIYGNSRTQSDKIRELKGGLLKISKRNDRQWLPLTFNTAGECGRDIDQCYNIPDSRNRITPTIVVLHTIFLREHNRIAKILAELNPQYTDERLFQEARRINIAQYQKITYYDYIPLIFGSSYAYDNGLIHYVQNGDYVYDYDETVNPAPYAEHATAAYRYLHNQIPGWFSLVTSDRVYNRTLRLSDFFGRAETLNLITTDENFDSLIRGLVTQLQKRTDTNIDTEIKHHFNRKSFEGVGTDLRAIDIQRGRDYGLASYNDLRHYCGLPRVYDWVGFSNEISPTKIKILQRFYESPHDVDLIVGGSLESHVPDALLGPTFQCILTKQFINTRAGDRLFFEHDDIDGGFSRDQLREIRKSSVSSILCNNADYLELIQPNGFIVPNVKNVLKNCNTIPQVDLSKWKDA